MLYIRYIEKPCTREQQIICKITLYALLVYIFPLSYWITRRGTIFMNIHELI